MRERKKFHLDSTHLRLWKLHILWWDLWENKFTLEISWDYRFAIIPPKNINKLSQYAVLIILTVILIALVLIVGNAVLSV